MKLEDDLRNPADYIGRKLNEMYEIQYLQYLSLDPAIRSRWYDMYFLLLIIMSYSSSVNYTE